MAAITEPRQIITACAHVCGYFCLVLALAMFVPMGVDLIAGHADWLVFFTSAVGVGVLSLLLVVATRAPMPQFSLRFGFLLVNALWASTSVVAAVPLLLSGVGLSFTDAVFEAVSGLTTTGSTVISGLDSLPPGILLWRSMIQWFGGLGVIAMGLLLLPFLKVGGMQIYQMESSNQTDNPYAKFAAFSRGLLNLYLCLSLACFTAYFLAGMSVFDAINHAMTTVSTGGYSTHDSSLGGFGNGVLVVSIVFMLGGAMPFVALLRVLATGKLRDANDPQIPVLLIILALLTLGVALPVLVQSDLPAVDVIVGAAFNIASVITTTGYASADYTQWGTFAVVLFFIATFLGGAAGSTSGGIKTYRLILLALGMGRALKELIYPNGVFIIHYAGREVSARAVQSVAFFVAFFVLVWLLASAGLSATGLDMVTSVSGALTALTNVGPGLGDIIGPAGNFSSLPAAAKWILVVTMLLGRLEILTVLVVISPIFWRR